MSWMREIFGQNSLGAAGLGAPPGSAGLGIPSSQATSPGTGGGQNAGQLEPHTRAAAMAAGVRYHFIPVSPPLVRVADDPSIVFFPRWRTLIFGGNGVAAATTVQQWQFSVPTIIVARTAAAVMDDNVTGLQVGRNPLDTFRIQMARAGSQTDLIDAGGGGAANPAVNVLGSTLLGTAERPAWIPGNGLFIDVGGFINCTVQVLLANILVCVTLHCLEEYGPARG